MDPMAIAELVLGLEPLVQEGIVKLLGLIHHHPKPAAAVVAATKAVVATPDDANTNDPHSPYFVE